MPRHYREHYTVADYRQWEGDWELIHGMPYAMTPSPTTTHQVCVANLAHLIKEAMEESEGCNDCMVAVELDWEISNDTVVRPDMVLICHPVEERLRRTPALVAEVVSDSSANRDEHLKFELYEQQGVPWYLMLYPHQRLARIFRHQHGNLVKVADAADEKVSLEIGDCRVELNFGRVWR